MTAAPVPGRPATTTAPEIESAGPLSDSSDKSSSNPAAAPRGAAGGRIARGALALLSTQPLTWGASLLLAVSLPHYLGDRSLGEYTTALTLAGLVGILASLGVPTYLIRSVATLPGKTATHVGGSLVLVTSVTTLSAAVLCAVAPSLHLPLSREILTVILVSTAISGAQGIVFSQLIGQERHALFAWLNAGGVLLSAATGIGALAVGGGILGLVIAGSASSLFLFALTWRISGAQVSKDAFSPKLWNQLARGGIPFLGWNLALRIYGEADKLLLALLVPTAVVGWYGAAYRIIGIPVFVPTLITTPLLPALSRQTGDRIRFAETLRRATTCVLLLTVPISATIVVVAPAVPGILRWPAEFSASVPLMVILAIHQPFVAIDMVLATGLIALRQERKWLGVGIAASVFNLALNPIFIPMFQQRFANGAIAAAIITVVTELLTCVGAFILFPKDLLGMGTITTSLRILLAGFVYWLTATAVLQAAPLVAAVAAGGLSFVIAIWLLNVVRRQDLLYLRDIASHSFRRRLGRPT